MKTKLLCIIFLIVSIIACKENETPIDPDLHGFEFKELVCLDTFTYVLKNRKDRKVSIETVFNKIKTYKTTSDTRIKTDLLLDLCTLTNSELNDLLSRFGEKNEENAKLDRDFANYFR